MAMAAASGSAWLDLANLEAMREAIAMAHANAWSWSRQQRAGSADGDEGEADPKTLIGGAVAAVLTKSVALGRHRLGKWGQKGAYGSFASAWARLVSSQFYARTKRLPHYFLLILCHGKKIHHYQSLAIFYYQIIYTIYIIKNHTATKAAD